VEMKDVIIVFLLANQGVAVSMLWWFAKRCESKLDRMATAMEGTNKGMALLTKTVDETREITGRIHVGKHGESSTNPRRE